MSILKGEAALARKLHAQKETTGRIINHPPSEAYSEGWDRVFGKKTDGRVCERCEAPLSPDRLVACESCLIVSGIDPDAAGFRVWKRKRARPMMDGLAFIRSHPAIGDFWVCTGCRSLFAEGQELRCPQCDE